jgi:hypothetical protein
MGTAIKDPNRMKTTGLEMPMPAPDTGEKDQGQNSTSYSNKELPDIDRT